MNNFLLCISWQEYKRVCGMATSGFASSFFYSHGTSYFLKLVFSILMLGEFFSVVSRSQMLMLLT